MSAPQSSRREKTLRSSMADVCVAACHLPSALCSHQVFGPLEIVERRRIVWLQTDRGAEFGESIGQSTCLREHDA
jgi:hypothetical protein